MSYKLAKDLCNKLDQLLSGIGELGCIDQESRIKLEKSLLFLEAKEPNDYFNTLGDVLNSLQDEISDNEHRLNKLWESLDDGEAVSYSD